MVILKIPIVYLCLVVYYAIKATPKPEAGASVTAQLGGGPEDDFENRRHRPRRLPAYRARLGNQILFNWLISIGITQRKSLTIGAVAVPDAFFLSVVRGLLDGDGSVRNYWYTVPKGTRPYQALVVLFHCASRAHLEWLQKELTRLHGFRGALYRNGQRPHDIHVLKYATREARRLLPLLYPDDAPCLERKARVWRTSRDRELR